MKLDSKQKYDKIRSFVIDLKSREGIEPFLALEEISKFGIYDFLFINKNPPSFAIVEKNLRDSKYEEISEFADDLRKIFIAVSDYAFQDDPIQRKCEFFKEQIKHFQTRCIEDWQIGQKKIIRPRQPKQKQIIVEVQVPVRPAIQPQPVKYTSISQKKPTLAEKLEMVFLLTANQNNQPYIRSIGQHYGIGVETEDEYTINLDSKKNGWLNFITRKY